ncbi:cache domain-containing protein [Roseomonas sp. USHLN139]|uniref:cache domain-containing protein n=1 Tax=Roseomonas sp. USHLN139 TaxID=3081298 RepID=UPI003B018C99
MPPLRLLPRPGRLPRRAWLAALLLLAPGRLAAAPEAEREARQRAETEALLRRAAAYMDQVGTERALAAFNDPQGAFVEGERYVFCNGIDGTVLAHGFNPALLGRNLASLRDARGQPFAAALIRLAVTQGEGWMRYEWLNPATRRNEVKDTFVMRLREDIVCGTGHYGG